MAIQVALVVLLWGSGAVWPRVCVKRREWKGEERAVSRAVL